VERYPEAAQKLGKEFADKKKSEREKLEQELLKEGVKPKDLVGMNDTMVEGIYGQAYRLYNTGRYKDAMQIFRFLILWNATEPKYTRGLAACYHMLKEFENAAEAYTLCASVDLKNPIPYYHASDCYIQMKDYYSALMVLKTAIQRAGGNPEFKTIKDRMVRTAESLEKQLKKEKTHA